MLSLWLRSYFGVFYGACFPISNTLQICHEDVSFAKYNVFIFFLLDECIYLNSTPARISHMLMQLSFFSLVILCHRMTHIWPPYDIHLICYLELLVSACQICCLWGNQAQCCASHQVLAGNCYWYRLLIWIILLIKIGFH